jgi:predicted acyltransferase
MNVLSVFFSIMNRRLYKNLLHLSKIHKMKIRLESLDIFRGITICFMIIVNTPGDWAIAFNMLEHAKWDGFTPTDLVFPSFVFITGVSSWFSFKGFNHILSKEALVKIWTRTALLFLMGVALYAFPFYNKPIHTWRIMGVLERIALCYGIGATLGLLLNQKQIIGLSVALLLGYWGILLGFGDLTMLGNAVRKFDIFVMGESHLYTGEGVAFDPEGILSTLPSLVTYFIGLLTGEFLEKIKDKTLIINRLSLVGALLIVGGLAWDFAFPINKKLWTSSYVLLAGGLSLLIFTLCYYVVDVLGKKNWGQFFKVFGTNAILAYMISEVFILCLIEFIRVKEAHDIVINGHQTAFRYGFALWFGENDFASLLFALAYMFVCWLMVYAFYRKNIFLKI